MRPTSKVADGAYTDEIQGKRVVLSRACSVEGDVRWAICGVSHHSVRIFQTIVYRYILEAFGVSREGAIGINSIGIGGEIGAAQASRGAGEGEGGGPGVGGPPPVGAIGLIGMAIDGHI